MFLSDGWLRVGAMVKQTVQTAESVLKVFRYCRSLSAKRYLNAIFAGNQPTFPLKESNYRAKRIEQEVRCLKSLDFRGLVRNPCGEALAKREAAHVWKKNRCLFSGQFDAENGGGGSGPQD
jgi:hypothetical protein